MHRRAAFTLLELMVALALSGLVAAAATTATVSVYRSIVDMEHRTYAHEEAKTLIDALSTQTLQIGGGDVRPWQGVGNGCFTDASGALRTQAGGVCSGVTGGNGVDFLDLNDGGAQCRITMVSPTRAQGVGTTCCLSTANGFVDGTPLNVVLLPAYPSSGPQAGGGWRTFRCAPDTAGCACALSPVVGGRDLAPVNAFPFPAAYNNGLLAVGEAVSWIFDAPTHSLTEARDTNHDGTVERRLLSDRVFDFNIAWGYDGVPEDGVLDFTSTGPTWVVPLETRTATVATPVNDPTTLRMVRIGVLTGTAVSTTATPISSSLLGNPPRSPPGFFLQQAQTAVTLRNMLVFF